jgi:hypothetical protein
MFPLLSIDTQVFSVSPMGKQLPDANPEINQVNSIPHSSLAVGLGKLATPPAHPPVPCGTIRFGGQVMVGA